MRYVYTLGYQDLIVAPIYAILLYLCSIIIWKFFFSEKIKLSIFNAALITKLFSAVTFCLVYQFYYMHGDSFRYYRNGTRLFDTFYNEDFTYFVSMLNAESLVNNFKLIDFSSKYELVILHPVSFFTAKVSGFLGIFAMNSYVAVTFLFSFFCFSGMLAFLAVVFDKYKKVNAWMLASIFFVPSVCFWASSLLKDTILVGSLGWLFAGFYYMLKGKFKFGFLPLITIISLYLLITLKPFIVYAFVPAAFIYLLVRYNEKFKMHIHKIYFAMFGVMCLFGLGVIHYFIGLQNVYTIVFNKFLETSYDYQTYHSFLAETGEAGSGYDLGEIDLSFFGIVKKIPAAINVSLFRPYIWESKSLVMLVSAFESLAVFFFSMFVLFKVGLLYPIKQYFKDSLYAFLLTYALGFLFITGFITFNFGTLVRYKIPGMICYLLALSILLFTKEREKKLQKN